jgi:cation diffusion facilitator family transporter
MSQKLSTRQRTGQQVGLVSLLTNFVLFVGKFLAGVLTNSIAVIADSFNNLADCASSIATFLGFRLAARRADAEHPYGHGRMEYVAGLIVSMVILMTAISVGEVAISRIIDPEPVESSALPIAICMAAILTKLGLAAYAHRHNRRVKSKTLTASVRDSLSDVLSTTVALTSLLLAPLAHFPIDGILGLVVTAFIAGSGLYSFSDNLRLILGRGLDKATARRVRQRLHDSTIIQKVESLEFHDYGPENSVLLVRAQLAVSPHRPEFIAALDDIKRTLKIDFGIDETIVYWPPVPHREPRD